MYIERNGTDAFLFFSLEMNKCEINPCRNGGTCVQLEKNKFVCKCLPEYNGTFCRSEWFLDLINRPCILYEECQIAVSEWHASTGIFKTMERQWSMPITES